jgi:hypothetical protein
VVLTKPVAVLVSCHVDDYLRDRFLSVDERYILLAYLVESSCDDNSFRLRMRPIRFLV